VDPGSYNAADLSGRPCTLLCVPNSWESIKLPAMSYKAVNSSWRSVCPGTRAKRASFLGNSFHSPRLMALGVAVAPVSFELMEYTSAIAMFWTEASERRSKDRVRARAIGSFFDGVSLAEPPFPIATLQSNLFIARPCARFGCLLNLGHTEKDAVFYVLLRLYHN
jgi:hypothetical protein